MKPIIKLLFILLLFAPCIIFAGSNNNPCPPNGGDNDSIPPKHRCDTCPRPPSDSTNIPPVASADPNEIIGVKGYDTLQWIKATEQLSYTVYFENDPDFATAPAQKVSIRFAFDSTADMYSFSLGSFGFGSFVFPVEGAPNIYQQRLDVRDSLGIYVDVVAGLDVVKKEAFWIFSSIDPVTGLAPLEAMSGFLPVNDKEKHNGEGFVSFFMKPVVDAATRDSIHAEASIVFDTNEAIVTNVWVNTIDAAPPVSQLQGLQEETDPSLYRLRFDAADDDKGSGVKQVTVYYSENKLPYKELSVCRPDSVLVFALENSGEYAFYSLAEDHTGNREANKETPDFIINANTAPTDIILSDTIFSDDIALHGFIAELSAVDAESNAHFEYALAEGTGAIHNDFFRISDSQLQTATSFKCAVDTEYKIRLSATDIGGLKTEKDFVLKMNHVLARPEQVNVQATICEGDSYNFHGNVYTQTGNYTCRKENEFACDSVYVLDLTVNPYPAAPSVAVEGTHTLVSSALNSNQWYDENGVIEEATGQSFTPEATGRYYVTTNNGTCESNASPTYFVDLSNEARLQWDLAENWNWISINTSEALPTQSLLTPVAANVERIIGVTSEWVYNPESGISGDLTSLSAQNSYKLEMNNAATLSLEASVCAVEETTIALKQGWNWIGYLPVVELAAETALANLKATTGEVIKNQTDFSVFNGQKWVGTLSGLKSGEGYLYRAASDKSFTYSPVRASQVVDPRLKAAQAMPWECDPHQYPDNMNVIAQLYIDEQITEAGIYTVGAFCGNECRGVGQYVDGRLFITIHGEDTQETIGFKAYENATGEELLIGETFLFANTLAGTLDNPVALNAQGSNSLNHLQLPTLVLYPNPVKQQLFIGGLNAEAIKHWKILTTTGLLVLSADYYDEKKGMPVASLPNGTYILSLFTDEGVLYRKFIK